LAVISHWTPFLVLGVWFGGLADRYDCRKIIIASQVAFIAASLAWALLFLTGTLQTWHAVILLIIHGLAGALWSPAGQLIIHDIVGHEQLQSGVRLAATGRSIGILFGPAFGSAQDEITYSVLLTANAAGSVLGGFGLEALAFFRQPRIRTAVLLALAWGTSILVFALTPIYGVAVLALLLGGVLNIGF